MSDTPTRSVSEGVPFNRRKWLIGGGITAAALAGAGLVRHFTRQKASVCILKDQTYGGGLVLEISDALLAVGLDPKALSGKRVLLKPNMVEPSRDCPHMTTHPAMIVAAAEVFRAWGAQDGALETEGGLSHERSHQFAFAHAVTGP